MRKIDIIIPLFNGQDFFVKCLESVLKYNDLDKLNIVIIDDASTEDKLLDFLKEVSDKKIPNLTILKNDKNYGFVKTVNRGMSHNKINDVILLNTDTVVTENWWQNMAKACYSKDNIATVTPLSNNATLTSVPIPFVKNELFDGVTAEDYSKIVQSVGEPKYYELPTANGFCMYISRQALNEIGLFDYDKFGAGYGEETDFCLRARKRGYINIVADNVYIEHLGSATFSIKSREQKVKNAIKIIKKEYPKYSREIFDFGYNNPLKPLCDKVKILQMLWKYQQKKKLLLYKHYEATTAGTGVYVYDIARSKSSDWLYIVMCPTPHDQHKIEIMTDNGVVTFNISSNEPIEKIIDMLGIDLLHVNFLTDYIKKSLKNIEIPKIISVHEYSFISPDNPFIVIPGKHGRDRFAKSLVDYFKKVDRSEQEEIDQKLTEIYSQFDKILFLSPYMLEQIKTIFPKKTKIFDEKTIILPPKLTPFSKIKSKDGKKTIAYLAPSVEHKGIIEYLEICSDPQIRQKYKFLAIGSVKHIPRPLLKMPKLLIFFGFKVKKSGEYKKEELGKIFEDNNVEIVIIPSLFAETYSYTLSEASMLVDKVLVNSVGALAWRAKHENIATEYNCTEEAKKIILHNSFKKTDNINTKEGEFIEKYHQITDEYVKNSRSGIILDIEIDLSDNTTNKRGVKNRIRERLIGTWVMKLIKDIKYYKNEYLG